MTESGQLAIDLRHGVKSEDLFSAFKEILTPFRSVAQDRLC